MKFEKSVERQTKNTIEYYKILDNIEEVPINILRTMYKDLLQELDKLQQKKSKVTIKQPFIEVKWKDLEPVLKPYYIPKNKIEDYKNKFIKESKKEKVFMTESSQINASLISLCEELLEDK